MKKILFTCIGFSILMSCGTQKTTVSPPNKNTTTGASERNLFEYINTPLNFSRLKIKATAEIQTNKNSPSVALTLYINHGKQIWSNASMAFITVARANITPSSFKMYEKLGKTYIDSDYQFLNNLLKIDFLDYDSAEALLTGRIFFPLTHDDFNFSDENNTFILTSKKAMKIGAEKDSGAFDRTAVYDGNFNLKQVVLEDKIKNVFLQIDYENYVVFEGINLPKSIKIFIKQKKESKISLEYNKFEVGEMETPFDIPKGYTQKEIK
ncbi:MAG: DUF4292 domain-containing protein [Flavobacteriaceae bacterium]|jgi:hypothetical protein|nr:DUF4292 domain-containing protein [Flavobacteriaceae bacterium]